MFWQKNKHRNQNTDSYPHEAVSIWGLKYLEKDACDSRRFFGFDAFLWNNGRVSAGHASCF